MKISIEHQNNNEAAQERCPGVMQCVGLAVVRTVGALIRAADLDKTQEMKSFHTSFKATSQTDRI